MRRGFLRAGISAVCALAGIELTASTARALLGDAGMIDEDGFLWVQGRRDAVIVTGGENVVPEEVEEVLAAHPDVADAAESLTVIDRDLKQSAQAAIPDWETALRVPSAELRLVARHIGYVARAGELDPTTDAIARSELRGRPVQLHRFEDLVVGIRTANDLLRRSELSARDLRSFALMQSDIANTCADLAASPGLARLRESFRRRDDQYRELAGATSRRSVRSISNSPAILPISPPSATSSGRPTARPSSCWCRPAAGSRCGARRPS